MKESLNIPEGFAVLLLPRQVILHEEKILLPAGKFPEVRQSNNFARRLLPVRRLKVLGGSHPVLPAPRRPVRTHPDSRVLLID